MTTVLVLFLSFTTAFASEQDEVIVVTANPSGVAATEDQNIWTKATHGNCVLDLEFKFEPGANSGVSLYNSDETNWMPGSTEIADLRRPCQAMAGEACQLALRYFLWLSGREQEHGSAQR